MQPISDSAPATSDHPAHDVSATAMRSCANCGRTVAGAYCGTCGQSAHIHRSLAAIGHDAMHGVLHVEGRVWRTLALLAARPGELTRRYIDGQRARFVGPFALFLFALFAAYVVLTSARSGAPGDPLDAQDRALLVDYRTNLARVEKEAADLAARGKADPRSLSADDQEALAMLRGRQAMLRDLSSALAARERAADAARSDAASEVAKVDVDVGVDVDPRDGPTVVIGAPGVVVPKGDGDAQELSHILSWHWLDGLAVVTDMPLFARIGAKLRTNPGLFAYKMQTTAYKYAWALIPLSLPLMALLFMRRRLPLYDHYVFVGYSMAWMLAMIASANLLGMAPALGPLLFWVPLLAMPWHLYRQLRGAYALGRFGAMWRTLALGVGALMLILLFGLALVGAGALG